MRLTQADVSALDELVRAGEYKNRSEALRAALAGLLRERRERSIEDAYRRGYGEHPQEEWVGAAGMAGLTAFDESEGGDPL